MLLKREHVNNIVESLFPTASVNENDDDGYNNNTDLRTSVTVMLITDYEFDVVIKRMCSKQTAPGPDGFSDRILLEVCTGVPEWIRGLLNKCLVSGTFPRLRKKAQLLLLRKRSRMVSIHHCIDPCVYWMNVVNCWKE